MRSVACSVRDPVRPASRMRQEAEASAEQHRADRAFPRGIEIAALSHRQRSSSSRIFPAHRPDAVRFDRQRRSADQPSGDLERYDLVICYRARDPHECASWSRRKGSGFSAYG